ncbi:MAG: outer membrane protein assembly factor BamC, partial [Gammaproteobacteria bacterium]
ASIFTDDQGLQTLYIPDIYERVYPTVITSLEILGVNIINQDQSSGTIEVTLEDKAVSTKGFFDNLFGINSSENFNIKVDLGDQGKSTLITIENNAFTQINSPASEEVLRGLFVNLR